MALIKNREKYFRLEDDEHMYYLFAYDLLSTFDVNMLLFAFMCHLLLLFIWHELLISQRNTNIENRFVLQLPQRRKYSPTPRDDDVAELSVTNQANG